MRKMTTNEAGVETNRQGEFVHKFEMAGLGKAPYRFEGMTENKYVACQGAPVQPGSSCDFCGTAIMFEFWIVSSCGKRSKVGCDCISRVHADPLDPHTRSWIKLVSQAEAAQRDHNRALIKARDEKKTGEIEAALADPAMRAKLAALPHPIARCQWGDNTALTFCEWMLQNAGAKGRAKVAKFLKTVA